MSRYVSIVKRPEHAGTAGYMGAEVIAKFNEDGVQHELATHFGLEDDAISNLLAHARRLEV